MGFALPSGITGLQAHQKMLDIADVDQANVKAAAFKSGKITFSELLSETIEKASQQTSAVSGTNSQQMGGNIVITGNPFDLAIEGEGYFVLSGGSQNIYSRVGAFSVDANSNLVDPATGYIVQRIGSIGESEGFQTAGDSSIKVPYDVTMAAHASSLIAVSGNLSADQSLTATDTNVLKPDISFTVNGVNATAGTKIGQLDQFSGSFGTSGKLYVTGVKPDGTAVSDTTGLDVDSSTTLSDVLGYIETQFGDGNVTASISNGCVVVTDANSGYSRTDIKLAYAGSSDGSDSLITPGYFEIATVGGDEVKNVNITVYDSKGGKHVLSGAFVRTDAPNTWDMVLTSITGSVNEITFDNRRISGISFDATDGSYSGMVGSDTSAFVVTFADDTSNPQTIAMSAGTAGQFDGLTQFAGASTAVARDQDGYEAGGLSSVSVNDEGVLIGTFSNGIKKNIAALQIALFQDASGLEDLGGGYFAVSTDSGEAVAVQAMSGGVGSVHGGALEKSNADVANEFVTMTQAQNGFRSNARTIIAANNILRELTGLIK